MDADQLPTELDKDAPRRSMERLVVRSSTAWDAIGWDDGIFRIKGGRTTYEAVMYNCANNGDKVKLAKLVPADGGIREVSRYVDPDTVLEFLSSHNSPSSTLNEP